MSAAPTRTNAFLAQACRVSRGSVYAAHRNFGTVQNAVSSVITILFQKSAIFICIFFFKFNTANKQTESTSCTSSTQCQDYPSVNLVCNNGFCSCSSGYYWNVNTCGRLMFFLFAPIRLELLDYKLVLKIKRFKYLMVVHALQRVTAILA